MEGKGSRRGRPKKPGGRKVTTSMRLDPALRRTLETLAKRRGVTLSSLIEMAIERELDRSGV